MKKLTATEKKKITNDWRDVLKHYTIYKTFNLIKRNGPILTGIYMERVYAGERYTPVFYVYSLMIPSPTIYLTTYSEMKMKGGQVRESISCKRHSDEFEKIISEFRSQYPIAFLDHVDFEVVSSHYTSYIENSPYDYPIRAMTDHVLLMFWCGKQPSIINNQLEKYDRIISEWPEGAGSTELGDRNKWKENVQRLMNLQDLSRTVESEVANFKIEKIKAFSLIDF